MPVHEADLPGVGKRFEIDLPDGSQVVIVIHNTGKRELYVRETEGEDARKLLELTDRMARTIGTVLEGTYFQPIPSENIEAALDDDSLIEWATVDEDSALVGETIAGCDIRQRTGVSIIAVVRDEETIPNPEPDFEIAAGDTLVGIGSREDQQTFLELAAGT